MSQQHGWSGHDLWFLIMRYKQYVNLVLASCWWVFDPATTLGPIWSLDNRSSGWTVHLRQGPYMGCTQVGVQPGQATLGRSSLREHMAQPEPCALLGRPAQGWQSVRAGPVPDTFGRKFRFTRKKQTNPRAALHPDMLWVWQTKTIAVFAGYIRIFRFG